MNTQMDRYRDKIKIKWPAVMLGLVLGTQGLGHELKVA